MSKFSFSCNNRRPCVIAMAVVAALGGLGLAAVILGNFDEKRRFAGVAIGMTKEQVLQTIGMPPGEYGPPGAQYGFPMVVN